MYVIKKTNRVFELIELVFENTYNGTMAITKFCYRCSSIKSTEEFYVNKARADGLSGYCCECMGDVNAEVRLARRLAMLKFLGNKCCRCGFDDVRALEIDHINGGGGLERKTIGSNSAQMMKRIQEHPEEYQLMCANCHAIKSWENQETERPGKPITRQRPKVTKEGPGRGSAEGTRKAAANWWATATPKQIAERNAKISATKRGQKLSPPDADDVIVV